ncbi:MAG: response regulator [bacterium]
MDEKKRILVVEDEEAARLKLTRLLENYDFHVVGKADGKQALEELGSNNYDLIITDLKMPQMNGIDLLREAKKINPYLGIIIVTAYGEVDTYLEAMNLGAFEYLNKPIKLEELMRVIKKVLN